MDNKSQPPVGRCLKRSTKECCVTVDITNLCDLFEPNKKIDMAFVAEIAVILFKLN